MSDDRETPFEVRITNVVEGLTKRAETHSLVIYGDGKIDGDPGLVGVVREMYGWHKRIKMLAWALLIPIVLWLARMIWIALQFVGSLQRTTGGDIAPP